MTTTTPAPPQSAPDLDPWLEDGTEDEDPPAPPPRKANPGAAVLDQTRAFIARFATFPSEAALDVATVWAAHTHVVDTTERLAFDTSPRLIFLSDKPASGKTCAMEATLRLAYHGAQVVDPTPTTFATMVSEERATVAIDELDVLFGAGAAKATLRSLLNAGYKRGAKWSRGSKAPVHIFAAVTMAGLGAKFRTASELSPLRGRSLMIEMQPANPPETFRSREHEPMAAYLRDALTAWAKRYHAPITQTWPAPPEGIANRQAEVAEPLLQVADVAGGHWPETIRLALRELLLGELESPDETPLADRLLLDLEQVYGTDVKLSTIDIIDRLYALPGAPWRTLWPNRNTAPRELAAMLLPLGITPCPVWMPDQRTLRGYHRDALAPLWDDLHLGRVDLDSDEREWGKA